MLSIGLTGGVATGKSHVRAQMAALGWSTIDADRLAREVVRPGQPAWREIRDRFGDAVCGTAGVLNRQALGSIVFSDADARKDLEAIIHPRVYAAIQEWLDRLAREGAHAVAVADMPLLYETGHDADFDRVIVVVCTPETQLRRVMARDGLDDTAARQRIAAQWPTADKAARADIVISTDGSIEETNARVAAVVEQLS